MIKSYQTAQHLAQELLAQAQKNEPKITANLQNIAEKVSAEIVGLENKFKMEKSLVQKLVSMTGGDFQKLQRKAKSLNDVLRYTFILPFEVYAETYYRTLKLFSELDYYIPEHRIWNAWETIGEKFDRGYRGINITVISSQKQKFELQFHTEDSFRLKTKTHPLYKEMKRKEISEKRQDELIFEVKEMAKVVKRPQGV